MLAIIFNHDMHDDPYKQTSVDKGFKALYAFTEKLGEKYVYTSYGARRTLLTPDITDDYVVVKHTADFSGEHKIELTQIISEILTVKKVAYPEDEKPKILIVFEKVFPSDCFEL